MVKKDVTKDGRRLFDRHEATLDAHTFSSLTLLKTGQYFYPFPISGHTTAPLEANRIRAIPFFVARNMTIDRIAIQVTGAGGGGKVCRLGIYNNGTNNYPGTLVLDAGTVAIDATAVVAATISESLTKGLYWLVEVPNDTGTVVAMLQAYPIGGTSPTAFTSTNEYHWYKDGVTGSLADPFPAGGAQVTGGLPAILPRLLSLD